MKYAYRAYQLLVAAPTILALTVVCALIVIAGTALGSAHFWGYYPPKLWCWLSLKILLLPVKVEGREHIEGKSSYVFVANHQGAIDIFLIYGHLGRNFKWMMKKSLRKLPLVGYACQRARHIFVDRSSQHAVKETYRAARRTLQGGTSLVVFPEGARTFTGHMGFFRKGAFMLAREIELPIVPLTINGSFDVLPRMRGLGFADWHPLKLTIHAPIDSSDMETAMKQAYDIIETDLAEEYKGYVENKDQ